MRALLIAAAVLLSSPAAAQVYSSLDAPAKQAQVDALMMATSQSTEAVLDGVGSYTWTFPVAFTAKPRIAYFPQNSDVTGKPIVCNYQTLTATYVTFHCDKGVGSIAGLLSPLFNANGAAAATVQVIARGTLVAPLPPGQ